MNISKKGFYLVSYSDNLSGIPLCLALIKNFDFISSYDVYAVPFILLPDELPDFGSQTISVSSQNELSFTEQLSKNIDLNKGKKLVFIDSGDFLLNKLGLSRSLWLLQVLIDSDCLVLMPISSTNQSMQHFVALAETVIKIGINGEDTLYARQLVRKKGIFEEKMIGFSISTDFTLKTFNNFTHKAKILAAKPIVDFEDLPFNVGLNLSEREKKAKQNLRLPYTGLVDLNILDKKVRAGGQILYIPEKEDDLDEDDPDDDLFI